MSTTENQPVVALFELSGADAEQYDRIVQAVEAAGLGQPEGRLFHLAYATEDGLVVMDVWESGDRLRQFATTLMPKAQEAGLSLQPQVYPVHNIIAG